jgi:hypothetical protein
MAVRTLQSTLFMHVASYTASTLVRHQLIQSILQSVSSAVYKTELLLHYA